MSAYQQSICQKLAQITFDDSLSSQSSTGDEKRAVNRWNGVDERNLALLFWDNLNDKNVISRRLINLLKITAENERLSKDRTRTRKRRKSSKNLNEESSPVKKAND